MILWRNIENQPFLLFQFRPQISPFLLYVRWKSGVTFVRRCFRDDDCIGDYRKVSTYPTLYHNGSIYGLVEYACVVLVRYVNLDILNETVVQAVIHYDRAIINLRLFIIQ